jgi:hypothetical protein
MRVKRAAEQQLINAVWAEWHCIIIGKRHLHRANWPIRAALNSAPGKFQRLFAFAFALAYSTYLCLAVAALTSTYVSTVPVPGTKLRKLTASHTKIQYLDLGSRDDGIPKEKKEHPVSGEIVYV